MNKYKILKYKNSSLDLDLDERHGSAYHASGVTDGAMNSWDGFREKVGPKALAMRDHDASVKGLM